MSTIHVFISFIFYSSSYFEELAKMYVWSIMLHESETWTVAKEDLRKIETFEM